MTIPFADPVVVALLAEHFADEVGDRVSTTDVGPSPSLRVTLLYDEEPPTTWERTPIFQVEVWADDAYAAGVLATRITNVWPTLRRVNAGGAYVSGCWIDSHPRPLPDPDTDRARYLLQVGLRIHAPKE